MKHVEVFTHDGGHLETTVDYAWGDELCENMNTCLPDLFINICGILIRKGDIYTIKVTEIIPTTKGAEANE